MPLLIEAAQTAGAAAVLAWTRDAQPGERWETVLVALQLACGERPVAPIEMLETAEVLVQRFT